MNISTNPQSCSFFYAAPSGPPTIVGIATSPVTITVVFWKEVECIHRNGAIIRYIVRYKEVNSDTWLQNVTVEGDTREVTLSGLYPSTNYSIEVAAINSIGTVIYSEVIYNKTRGNNFTFTFEFII